MKKIKYKLNYVPDGIWDYELPQEIEIPEYYFLKFPNIQRVLAQIPDHSCTLLHSDVFIDDTDYAFEGGKWVLFGNDEEYPTLRFYFKNTYGMYVEYEHEKYV